MAREMTYQVRNRGNRTVFTYYMSCAGNLTWGDYQGATHLLPKTLGCDKKPDIGKPMVNRILARFWQWLGKTGNGESLKDEARDYYFRKGS